MSWLGIGVGWGGKAFVKKDLKNYQKRIIFSFMQLGRGYVVPAWLW